MSVYTDADQSAEGGAPVECYKFTGTFTTYLYTTSDEAVVIGADTYLPTVMERSSLVIGVHIDDTQELTLTCPTNIDLVLDYAFQVSPPDLSLQIIRFHRGTDPDTDSVIYWTGSVASIVASKHEAQIRVPSIFGSAMKGNIPRIGYQFACNHRLYDGRCKLDINSWSFTSTVAGVDGVSVVTATLSAFPDGTFVGGELAATVSGERRMIIAHTGSAITVNFPFSGLVEGDAIQVSAGCDHSFATCGSKFSNQLNYGGFKFTPNVNPFVYGL